MKYIKILIIILVIIILPLIAVLIRSIDTTDNNTAENNVSDEGETISSSTIETESSSYKNTTSENKINNSNETTNNISESSIDTSIKPVTDRNLFYTVEDCINNFINYGVDKNYDAIYALLTQNFIDENNITKENVSEKIQLFEKKQIIRITDMYMQNMEQNGYTKYYTHLKVRENKNYSEDEQIIEDDYYITVVLNDNEMYYTIIPGKDYYDRSLIAYKGGV